MIAIFFIIIGILTRLLPHPANFAPITAIALFSSVYLPKRLAFVVPLLAMILSDLVLGFHSTMPYVYGSIFLTSVIGVGIRRTPLRQGFVGQARRVVIATLGSSILFFIITNFGVWKETSLYPKTIDGLLQSYIMALPFFRNSVLGDLFYTAVLFGSYELVQHSMKKYQLAKT